MSVSENPTFRTILDACNCLGQNYKGAQRGWYKSKIYENYTIWFPKFYENREWDNKISKDGKTIYEKLKIKIERDKHYEGLINGTDKRIVFPRSIDNLEFKLYRFRGVFIVDKKRSSPKNGMVYKRIATEFKL